MFEYVFYVPSGVLTLQFIQKTLRMNSFHTLAGNAELSKFSPAKLFDAINKADKNKK